MPGSHPVDTAHVVPLLESYHAGALAPEAAAEVRQHLSACALCRGAADEIALYQIIRAAPAPRVGPELRQRVYARIETACLPEGAAFAPPRDQPRRSERHSATLLDHPRRSHALGGWLTGVAALALIALIVGVFWVAPHAPRQRGRTGAPSDCLSSGASATAPSQPYILNALAMTSATDGWAVGAYENADSASGNGLIMRYSKCHWAPVTLSLPNVVLEAISMDSPTDGWAAGENVKTNKLTLLRYSAGAWRAVTPPAAPKTDGAASRLLDMTSPTEGWLVVVGPGSVGNGYVAAYAQTIFHDSQGAWSAIDCPLPMIDAITSAGPDDLWVAGRAFGATGKETTQSFAHYQHGHWSVMAQPSGLITLRLAATSPTDVWASGIDVQGFPVVAHYDGASWQDVPQALPPSMGHVPGIVVKLADHEGWAYTIQPGAKTAPMESIPELSVTRVWRETAGQWQALSWRYTDIQQIDAWTSLPNGEIWAVGSYRVPGTPTPLPGGGSTRSDYTYSVLLHYANGVWTRNP